MPKISKQKLEKLYNKYNHRKYVHPDPLEFLYNYQREEDKEIVGLVASSLAYGRVEQILRSVSHVLEKIGPSPYEFILNSNPRQLRGMFNGFSHRFTRGGEISDMLYALKQILNQYGSLREFFYYHFTKCGSTPNAMDSLVDEIYSHMKGNRNSLLPIPSKGSACKRLNLFLRWMVRKDEVDPGSWTEIPPSKLIIPLDTHMFRICKTLRLTKRNSQDMKTALEITEAFSAISPDDPVKYDFSLTRMGILEKATYEELLG